MSLLKNLIPVFFAALTLSAAVAKADLNVTCTKDDGSIVKVSGNLISTDKSGQMSIYKIISKDANGINAQLVGLYPAANCTIDDGSLIAADAAKSAANLGPSCPASAGKVIIPAGNACGVPGYVVTPYGCLPMWQANPCYGNYNGVMVPVTMGSSGLTYPYPYGNPAPGYYYGNDGYYHY